MHSGKTKNFFKRYRSSSYTQTDTNGISVVGLIGMSSIYAGMRFILTLIV